MVKIPSHYVCGNCKNWSRDICKIHQMKTCGLYGCEKYEKRDIKNKKRDK